jgi:hypothetical protein
MLLAALLLGLCGAATLRIPAEGEELEDEGLVFDVEPPPINNNRFMEMLDETVTQGENCSAWLHSE